MAIGQVSASDALTALLVVGIAVVIMFQKALDVYPDFPVSKFWDQTERTNTRKEGESVVFRSRVATSGFLDNASTGYEMFWKAVEKHKSKNYIARNVNGAWAWLTFEEFGARVKYVGSGLLVLTGVEPTGGVETRDDLSVDGSRLVGLYLPNSIEWVLTDLACCSYGLVTVPLYDTFDTDSLRHIVKSTGMSIIITAQNHLENLFEVVGEGTALKTIVVSDLATIPSELKQRAEALHIRLSTFKEMEATGSADVKDTVAPKSDDLFTICFTSGTTSLPKGVMITHGNLAKNGAGVISSFPQGYKITEADRHLSYLPLSHMFERTVFHTLTHLGVEIGFYSGNIAKLFDDISSFKPSLFPTVPRLLVRLHDKILEAIETSTPIKRALFKMAYASKKRMLARGCVTRTSIWDSLVFGRIQKRVGGRIRMMLTGAAPIDPVVLEFFRIVFGCQVLEGYGQTETCGAGFTTAVGDYSRPFGHHIGGPIAGAEVKLVDVKDMEYLATDKPYPRGEVCVRGPHVMKGYFRDVAATKAAIDKDGFLHSGDIGELLPNGTLRIVDRIKNIFKLSQGEYVVPDRVESKIKPSYIQQVFVYGDPLRSSVVAILVPDTEGLFGEWLRQQAWDGTFRDACKSEGVQRAVLKEVTRLGKLNGLHAFEIPKAIRLMPEPMTTENGLLTPTFKIKRHLAKNRYKPLLDTMYDSLHN
ncbi:uncharacterized protein EV422DRAFT_23175 [Fimicolochytrium jonesii]|uniref:uncharacterized protein n=1 Tax=Fimicolochytrium jonesii TaxID=1396493 RepID=UPI0022FE3596|nr:uncharacterized protein EV422DRAFT_23175 [Fimicolochytrium jonesii]KAI8827037.1 hypothetical protein EV422DRAFT_23175 [Fimicolochytrium jonesii]